MRPPDAVAELAPARGEHLLEEVVAADRLDRREQARGEAVVVRREEVLRVRRDVVQVARPADAVADRLAADEVRGLERAELLEDAGPAGAERGRRAGRASSGRRCRRRTRIARRRPGRADRGRVARPARTARPAG